MQEVRMTGYSFCLEVAEPGATYHIMKRGASGKSEHPADISALCGVKCKLQAEEVNEAILTAQEWRLCKVCDEIRRQEVAAAATKAARA
jgi:hypothetical protein